MKYRRAIGMSLSLMTLLLLSGYSSGCQPDESVVKPREWPNPGMVDLSTEWVTMPPHAFDIDDDRVSEALADGDGVEGLESVVIIKNGRLIGERYFEGDMSTLRHVRSCTKSILALLTGIALDSAILAGVDDSIGHYLVPDIVPTLPSTLHSLTIRQLLTMRTGLAWDEGRFTEWTEAPHQLAFMFDFPATADPGTVFRYNSPASHLLGIGLASAFGRSLHEVAREHLFAPLGIMTTTWEEDRQGYDYGAYGLQFRTRDMAKIGYAMIQRGHTGVKPLLDSAYLNTARSNLWSTTSNRHAFEKLGYGYLWWTDESPYGTAFFAWGYGGQLIYCVPDQYLVIATTARWLVDGETDDRQLKSISNYLIHTVLKSVQ